MNIPTDFKTHAPVKIPKMVKVIRKTETVRDSWWSPEYGGDKFYSSFFNDKQYIYSFLTEQSAERCNQFLKKYKSVYKRYPDLHCNRYKFYKNVSLDPFTDTYIDDETLTAMTTRCLLNGVGLIGISHFDYTYLDSFIGQKDVFNLQLSAVDLLENQNVDFTQHVDNLNYLMDF
jgi:hypothetical protein